MAEISKIKKILITGGHMTPAFAVQEELRGNGFNQFIWVGHKYNQSGATDVSPEYKTVTAMSDTIFIDLPAGKLVRSWYQSPTELWLAIVNLLKIPYGFLFALWILIKHRPKFVASFGGYLAVPVVLWAKLLGIKSITHEQTVTTGKANSVLAKLADKIFISWPETAKFYPNDKTILSGNPIRKEVFEIKSQNINFNNNLPTVYVTGGNQGAVVINKAILAALPELLTVCNVVHQTGSAADTVSLLATTTIPTDLPGKYLHQAFLFENEIGEAYAKADLVISRAGANSVTELIALNKPCIFIPIPWVSQNEQMRNAQFAHDLGIAQILPEADLTSKTLLAAVKSALSNTQRGLTPTGISLSEAAETTRNILPPDPAHTIVTEMLKL